MYPYDYTDLLQLYLNNDAPSFDYDFDAHIAQYARVTFGPDGKGILDGNRSPIPLLLSESDEFGSPCSSSSSRSSSIAADASKSEESDGEVITLPTLPKTTPLMKGNENASSFGDPPPALQVNHMFVKEHSAPKIHRSKTRTLELAFTVPSLHAPSLEPASGRKRPRKMLPKAPTYFSDDDADDESDSDTDDEYIPASSWSVSIKRRRTSHSSLRRSAPPTHRSSAPLAPIKRVPGTSLSRNKQALSAAAINKACDGSNMNFICPECGWKQANKRLPDFKRHLRTHTRPDNRDQTKGWWCKGILLNEAHKYDIPEGAKPYQFLGQDRIGGCMQTFSRRDALKRHLDNTNVFCVGRPSDATED